MTATFAGSLDALGGWRGTLTRQLDALYLELRKNDSLDAPAREVIASMRERLAGEKLMLAFVAEFSRGKSELINAIFFGDTGRRVLPATPGRTTMCPVELSFTPGEAPRLELLPIETRLQGRALAELRTEPAAWRTIALQVDSADRLAEALSEVKRVKRVSIDEARELGFWSDEQTEDNPPVEDGRVDVPLWRHALINYPHPLLERGLVVLDTPGLNAIGAEPELTLGLLPSAHAIVFILGADTGVTKSDLAIWRDHLGAQSRARYVVLNKIDTLVDPLASPESVQAQIEQQRHDAAHTLGVEPHHVFPLSARQALAARIGGDADGLVASRLPELENALSAHLLPQRREVLEQTVLDGVQQLETQLIRRLGDRRRQFAEQLLELRGLRGKSSAKLRLMLQRIDAEALEFEQCNARLQAMRSVHSRMIKDLQADLSTDRVRELVAEMEASLAAARFGLGAKKAFVKLCGELRVLLDSGVRRSGEIHQMLAGSFQALNADFGFGLALPMAPELDHFQRDLDLIEKNYMQYLGLKNAIRLSQPAFAEQFMRMLNSRLRVVFEGAASEVEVWNRNASAQVELQLRDRRQAFKRRREALERIQSATGELEDRIAEVETHDTAAQKFEAGLMQHLNGLRDSARMASSAAADVPGGLMTRSPAEYMGGGLQRIRA